MARKGKTGKCRLCGNEGLLCRSHIIPEFAYQPIKNQKGQMYSVSRRVQRVQTGHFERLLCEGCERLLSGWESKFKTAWMDSIPPDFSHLRTRPLTDPIQVQLDDYDTFKLFHLSVFWRAAVSTGFTDEKVSLGAHEARIAQMLLQQDPGAPGDYPFFATLNLDDQKRPVATVAPLAHGSGRYEGHDYYLMTYGYCDWVFIIGRPGPAWLADIEAKCRAGNFFLLSTTRFRESKGFKLAVDILRRLRS